MCSPDCARRTSLASCVPELFGVRRPQAGDHQELKCSSTVIPALPGMTHSYSRFPTAALTLVVPSLPSPSNALPSHSAIPKVGSRIPTIVLDAHSYSRFPAAALTLVVPSQPSPSNALPSHSAIPKVGSRIPTIVRDAHSYSRFPTAALTLVAVQRSSQSLGNP